MGTAKGILLALAFAVLPTLAAAAERIAPYRLAPGFVAEKRNALGIPQGTGFAGPNRWGEYTAYIMLTDAKGRRTWRIEHNLPAPAAGTAQGSSMYLLEGSQRALLIDTGNPAAEREGVNDLKTVVRYLLGRDNAGRVKRQPLDFVVANTHNHPDHIGENERMSDRIVYYMDGDWPQNAPQNYVPIREGGGATPNGKGMAVGEIDLGDRMIRAIHVPPHTQGSLAYLDADNRLLITGDALGSAWPFLQRGPVTRFVVTMRHLLEVTAPYPDLVLLPAHFYQQSAFDRVAWPAERQVLNRAYMEGLLAAAEGVVSGAAIGEPFLSSTADFIATAGTAKLVYRLDTIGADGAALPSSYHVARIPGAAFTPPFNGAGGNLALNRVRDIAAKLYLIRGPKHDSLYLLSGSERALLIGTGAGAPGLSDIVRRLTGALPLDVALLDNDATQLGGLAQLAAQTIYVGAGAALKDQRAKVLRDGETIDLGRNADGSPLRLEAQTLALPGKPSMSLFLRGDAVLFVGAAFGDMAPGAALEVDDPLPFSVALNDWMLRAGGRARIAYATPGAFWYSDPAWLEQLQAALARAITGRGAGKVSDGPQANTVRVTADTPAALAVSIIAPRTAAPN